MDKRNIVTISIIVWVFISIIAIGIYFLVPKTYIKFVTAPQIISVSIDGGNAQSITNGANIGVSSGKHLISISQNDFNPYVKEIDLKGGQTTEFIVALTPLTDAASELLKDDKSQVVLKSFYGKIYTQPTDSLIKNYPILSILPIRARLYTIYACESKKYSNDPTKIALCVDKVQSDLNPYVLKDIQSRGYEPTDYEIIWND
ncbi:MAG TPA: PEGA domain-containing protein [Candidatus Angelobacter sp.]|nr:PEGA domain-containing protein [Candidatus Angelobacter sp.]